MALLPHMATHAVRDRPATALSIVSTLYQSADHLAEFVARCHTAASQMAGADYEILLVNDGSPDDSLALALKMAEGDPRLTIVDLSRNFGHHRALMVGLDLSVGAHVFLIDSDLEEDPDWLGPFHAQMRDSDADVVFGVQEARKGGAFERVSGRVFYRVMNRLSGLQLHDGLVTARLMTRRYVDALLLHEEREIMLAGLWQITGFAQVPLAVKKASSDRSSYTLSKKIALMENAITSFSIEPLRIIFKVGLLVSSAMFSFIIYLCAAWLFVADPPSGWTALITAVLFSSGVMMVFLGVIGVYVGKIYLEVKRRPYAIIRKVYSAGKEEG